MNKGLITDIKATFDYLRDPPTDDPSIPLCYYTEDRQRSTMRVVGVEMPIADGRRHVDTFDLDCEGFQLVSHHSQIADFLDLENARIAYPAEAAELIRTVTGASAAFGFGFGVRFGRARTIYQKINDDQPARFPHADFTDKSAKAMLEQVGTNVGRYSRSAVYNVWRVISEPPQNFPLAVCDARTVARTDELQAEAIIDLPGTEPMKAMTTVYRPNSENRWTYFRDMTVDEALIFKGWDSDQTKAQRVPHSSFENPLAGPNASPRCSVEVRVAAYFQD